MTSDELTARVGVELLSLAPGIAESLSRLLNVLVAEKVRAVVDRLVALAIVEVPLPVVEKPRTPDPVRDPLAFILSAACGPVVDRDVEPENVVVAPVVVMPESSTDELVQAGREHRRKLIEDEMAAAPPAPAPSPSMDAFRAAAAERRDKIAKEAARAKQRLADARTRAEEIRARVPAQRTRVTAAAAPEATAGLPTPRATFTIASGVVR